MCPGPKLKTEDLLDRAALHIAKCPFAEKDVCRGVPPGYAPLWQRVCLEQGLCVAGVGFYEYWDTPRVAGPMQGHWTGAIVRREGRVSL